MKKLQFRVLYREFLFRMVDLEVLSAHAQGDSNQLVGRFASLMIFLSLAFSGASLVMYRPMPPLAYWALAGSMEHFLIATTMLIVGLFAVLSWDSTFPARQDVLVLTPLPLQPNTLFLAKVAAVATALVVTVASLHVLASAAWPLALNQKVLPVTLPTFTSDPALAPVEAAGLQAVLDRDLASALHSGNLAPGTGAGIAIGVYKHGARRVFAYGTAKPDSIFEIGSVTKTFTGLLLAQMVVQGKTRFDEPVRQLLPPDTVAKPNSGDEITLLDLATHHSGLPDEPNNFQNRRRSNPYADYHKSDLYEYFAKYGLKKPPSVEFFYSNLGFALLGQALANRAGSTWPDLVAQRITGPLGLKDTVVALSPGQRSRFLQGYTAAHDPVPAFDLDAMAGAGALRSTAGDMLVYLEANLHPEKLALSGETGTVDATTMVTSIRLSHVLRAEASQARIALAWIFDPATRAYFHNGATAGSTTYATFNPREDWAIIILSNTGSTSDVSAGVLAIHIQSRLMGTPAISIAHMTMPAQSKSILSLLRLFAVYWITMFAAGAFIFCCVLGVQGLATQLLPRRILLRVSAVLQLSIFCLLVTVYFVQPILATPDALIQAQGQGLLSWSPSYWFLGMFQQLNRTPAMAPLARKAWIGLAVAISGTAVAYAFSYFRTLRKIVEEPDILPGARGISWLPPFGNAPQTAIVQFAIRTLMRSRQHRVILAFYLSVGFAMTIFLLRSPAVTEQFLETRVADPLHEVSIPVLAATLVMMIFAVGGTRVLFSLPMDLRANWIFRTTAGLNGAQYLAAARRSLLMLSFVPVWAISATICFCLWPWRPALAHVTALGLLGCILADCSMMAFRKIPFTCSYLPGKSQVHMMILGAFCLLYCCLFAVKYEREVLENPAACMVLLVSLIVMAAWARWRSVSLAKSEATWARFEDAPSDEILVLGLAQPGQFTAQ